MGAEIGGSLICTGGNFEQSEGYALAADGIQVRAGVFLRDGFHAMGTIRFIDAHITGSMECTDASFRCDGQRALTLQGAQITGALFFRALAHPPEGEVVFSNATVGRLVDDAAAWPLPGELHIDGFVYQEIDAGSPLDAPTRLQWLELQADRGGGMATQPYEQLAAVYDRMGHENDAVTIRVAKQRALRHQRHRLSAGRGLSALLYWTIRYGWAPWRAVIIGMFVVALSAALFAVADGAFVSTNDAPPFFAPAFALDTFLPFVNLGQEEHWRPDPNADWSLLGLSEFSGWVVQIWLWGHILLGWTISTLAVAAFTGLVRRT